MPATTARITKALKTVSLILIALYIISPSVASAERTVLIINAGNTGDLKPDETIFDHEYARYICNLAMQSKEAFNEEWGKYDHKLAEQIYRYALKHGEDKAMP